MENIALIESFSEFKDDKLIDRVTLMAILEDVFRNALKKKYGSDDNFDIIINPDKGDMEIWRNRVVVADGEVEERPDAVHEKAGRGVYIQEEGHQHRGAKHGEEVLQREGDGGEEREPLLDLDDSFAHKILLLGK